LIGDSWQVVVDAPIAPRLGAAATRVGSYVLVWGGAGDLIAASDPSDFVYYDDGALYSLTEDTWTVLPDAPLEARRDAAAVALGRQVLIAGGERAGSGPALAAAILDVTANEWELIAEPPASSVIAAVSGAFTSFAPGGVRTYRQVTDMWGIVASAPVDPFLPDLVAPYGPKDAVVVQRTQAWIWRSDSNAFESLGEVPVDNVGFVGAVENRVVVWDESGPAAALYEPTNEEWDRLDPPNSFESRTGTAALCLTVDVLTAWSGWHDSESARIARDTGYRLTIPER
jgi:hypothetical protein